MKTTSTLFVALGLAAAFMVVLNAAPAQAIGPYCSSCSCSSSCSMQCYDDFELFWSTCGEWGKCTTSSSCSNSCRCDAYVWGSSGHDTLNGDSDNECIYGYGGDDTMDGNAGHDKLYGSSGDDTIEGGSGNDCLYGGSGSDYLDGGSGSDYCTQGETYVSC